MAEKADYNPDDGGGGGPDGGLTLTDEDAGFDRYADGFNEANRGEAGSGDYDSDKPDRKTPLGSPPTRSTARPVACKQNLAHL